MPVCPIFLILDRIPGYSCLRDLRPWALLFPFLKMPLLPSEWLLPLSEPWLCVRSHCRGPENLAVCISPYRGSTSCRFCRRHLFWLLPLNTRILCSLTPSELPLVPSTPEIGVELGSGYIFPDSPSGDFYVYLLAVSFWEGTQSSGAPSQPARISSHSFSGEYILSCTSPLTFLNHGVQALRTACVSGTLCCRGRWNIKMGRMFLFLWAWAIL